MKRRTKIVCTLGPAVDSKEAIKALIDAGMNVARLNCSHGDWVAKARWIEWIRELSSDCAPVAILADLQGPKFRIGDLEGGMVELQIGQSLVIGPEPGATIPISQDEIVAAMAPNGRILLGDGIVELRIGERKGRNYSAKVVSAGVVKSRQGITLVGKHFDVPALTAKDLLDVREAAAHKVDFLALSYVKNGSDLRDLRRAVERLDGGIKLCAKIETREAIRNLDEILRVADVVMVARGDLGLQMDLEEVPLAQKRIIERCTQAGCPVITATQMLESMMENPRPTRAETTDIANAILDGTDALMLSGETASGMYPIDCVKTMVRIAEKAETAFDRERIEREFHDRANSVNHTEAVAHAVADLTALLKPQAIITTTASGQTPRLVSKFRPRAQILCASYDERTHRQMAVVWGVESITIEVHATADDTIAAAIDAFLRRKRLKIGDLVIVTAGVPAGKPGNTNLILTQVVQ